MTISAKLFSVLAMFLGIKFVSAFFVEGHPVIISTKFFLILTTDFREDFFNFHYRDKTRSLAGWQPCYLTGQICFSYFYTGTSREHSCEVWLKLASGIGGVVIQGVNNVR